MGPAGKNKFRLEEVITLQYGFYRIQIASGVLEK